MQLWNDPAIAPVPVRWFRAAPGAKWLGRPTCFGSRNWDQEGKMGRETPLPFLGETQFQGPYDKGINRPFYPGGLPHGPDEAWARGGDPVAGPFFKTDASGALPGCVDVAIPPVPMGVNMRAAARLTAAESRAFMVAAALRAGAALPAGGTAAAAFLATLTAGLQITAGFPGEFRMTAALKAGLSSLPEAEATRLVALALKAGLEGLTAAEARESAALAIRAGLVEQAHAAGRLAAAPGLVVADQQAAAGAGSSRPAVPVRAGAQAGATGTGHTGPAAPSGLGLSATFQAVSSVPAGCVVAWPCASGIPAGWLACDGTEVSRATYPALFAALGTTWGAGNGTTTFNLPNLKYRFILGSGNDGAGNQTMPGDVGGERQHTLTAAEMPSHTHGPLAPAVNFVVGKIGGGAALAGGAGNVDTVPTTTAAGADTPHNNMPPYGSALWIIKA